MSIFLIFTFLGFMSIESAFPFLAKSHIFCPFIFNAEYTGGSCSISPSCDLKASLIFDSSMFKSSFLYKIVPDESYVSVSIPNVNSQI